MMTVLTKRAEALARQRQAAKLRDIAKRLRTLVGEGAVEVEEARVLVRGRGIIKRWLIDPSLRFLGRDVK